MSLDKGVPNPQELRNAVYCKVPHGYQIDPEEDVLVPMFQIPVAHVKVKNWEQKKKQLLSLYKNTQENQITGDDPFDVSTDYHYQEGGQYNESINNILDEELAVLEHLFLRTEQFCDEYSNEMGSEDLNAYFEISNSWFEKSKKFQAHYPHHHGPTGFSCVLYIFYDKEEHTPTTFMNPNLISSIGGQSDWTFENAQEGSLLCWPSQVMHYTHPNGSDKERMVLSFNMSVYSANGHPIL